MVWRNEDQKQKLLIDSDLFPNKLPIASKMNKSDLSVIGPVISKSPSYCSVVYWGRGDP